MFRKVLTASLLLLASLLTSEASAQTLDDTGLWFAAFTNGDIELQNGNDSGWLYWFDAHYRLSDDAGGFNQSILRPGAGLKLDNDQALWAGYAWINSRRPGANSFDEHRIWQQYTWAPKTGDWRFLTRTRLEQRWIETGDDVGHRLRQFLRAQYVIPTAPEWSLIGWDEAFFHLNDTDWGARSGLDQNRAFIGVGYESVLGIKVRTEVGYLNQFINVQGGTDRMNHILSINFFY